MTPEEQLKQLLDKLQSITGRNASMDPNQVKDFAAAIDKVTKAIQRAEMAADELADDFRTTTETLNAAYNSLEGVDRLLKQSLRSEFKKVDVTVKSIRNTQQNLLKGYVDEKEVLKNINKINNSINNIRLDNQQLNKTEIKDLLSSLKYTKSLAEEQLEISQYSKASTENINKFANLLSEIPIIGKSLSEPFRDISSGISENITKQQALNLELQKQFQQRKDLNIQRKIAEKNFGKNSDIAKQIRKEINGITAGMKETQAELNAIPSSLDVILNKVKKVSLQGLAIGILTKAFITLKSAIIEIDDQSTQLARSLSISKRQGLDLRDSFNDIARDSKLTTKELVDAQLTFTKLTGAASVLSTENLKALSEAKDLIGLSEGAQKGLISFASTTGEKYEDINNTILGTSKITQMQNGLMMDQKEILDEVLKTSYSLRAQFGNNVVEITKAVVEAKRLGFTLQDIESTQSNLLNFESSIAAELEAELLTGKELNLERARYFALTGDIRGLTQEINKNIGSSADFERMNVIQREAFAKSLGFSADKLAEILYTQEQNDAIAKSLNGQQAVANAFREAELDMNAKNLALLISQGKIDKEVLNTLGKTEKSQVSRLTTQQEFNRAVENLKEVFISIMNGPVGAFLDGFNSLFKTINSSPVARVITSGTMLVGLLGSTALIAASMAQLATKGTFFNPMIVKDIMGLGSFAGRRNLVTRFGGAANARRALTGGGLTGAGRGMGMIGRLGAGALGAGVGIAGGSALGGGGTGANIGSIGGSIAGGLIGQTLIPIPGVGFMIGSALGGLAGGAIGGAFDEPETTMKVNDFTIETNPNDKIGGVLDNSSVDKINSTLEALLSETRNMVQETKGISNMRIALDTGVIAGHMTNGGTKTG